jgi:hypothetical protein
MEAAVVNAGWLAPHRLANSCKACWVAWQALKGPAVRLLLTASRAARAAYAVRFTHLGMGAAVALDSSREIPPWPQP